MEVGTRALISGPASVAGTRRASPPGEGPPGRPPEAVFFCDICINIYAETKQQSAF